MDLNIQRANEILQKYQKRKQVIQFVNVFIINLIVVLVLGLFLSYCMYKIHLRNELDKKYAKRIYIQHSFKKTNMCSYKDVKCLKAYARKRAIAARISPKLFLSIITVESNWNAAAINKRSHDYGLTQINKANVKNRYELIKIRSSPEFAIDKALEILLHFKKTYSKIEPDTWFCRYNIGHQDLPIACEKYLNKLSMY